MRTLTIRLPDDRHRRLREPARHHSVSVNKQMEDLATISTAEFDAASRFRVLAARGSVKKGLTALNKLAAVRVWLVSQARK